MWYSSKNTRKFRSINYFWTWTGKKSELVLSSTINVLVSTKWNGKLISCWKLFLLAWAMNDEMAAVRPTEQSGGNEAICNRNKEIAGYITLHFWLSQLVFASLYSTSLLFSSYKEDDVSIPLYIDQTWGTLILCESKSWLNRSTHDHVGLEAVPVSICCSYKREQYLVDLLFLFWELSWNSSASFSCTMRFAVVRLVAVVACVMAGPQSSSSGTSVKNYSEGIIKNPLLLL